MNKHKKNIIILALAVILVIGAGVLVLRSRNAGNQDKNSGDNNTQSPAPISAPPSSESTVKDTGGQNSTQNNNPVQSSTRVITLNSPNDGAKLANGSTVSGTASVSQVQYRIKDNSRGVIGQGSLNVVNGRFSGELAVSSNGTTGTFEVYSLNPSTGAEENNIKINVTF